ncbi:MAG: hypothetical protein Q8K59_07675 [Nitrosomonas sp.]|nr:hypothetical protein [Nitrosomonas sp.]MDP1950957.1 hypothetical protein [Nitrosomonas sp.]
MVTKRGKQASRKAAARKYGFLEVPFSKLLCIIRRADFEIRRRIHFRTLLLLFNLSKL